MMSVSRDSAVEALSRVRLSRRSRSISPRFSTASDRLPPVRTCVARMADSIAISLTRTRRASRSMAAASGTAEVRLCLDVAQRPRERLLRGRHDGRERLRGSDPEVHHALEVLDRGQEAVVEGVAPAGLAHRSHAPAESASDRDGHAYRQDRGEPEKDEQGGEEPRS